MAVRLAAVPLLVLTLTLLAVAPAAGPARAGEAEDAAWIARCMAQLQSTQASEEMIRAYCTCMREFVVENEPVSQTEMERMYPPAHRNCRVEAGWK